MLADEAAAAALGRIIDDCRRFASAIPADETAQAAAMEEIISAAGRRVRDGALRLAAGFRAEASVIRLYKAPAGDGRLKLQLFPLAAGEAHPAHAHYNLLSCQIVLRGQVRMREYTLLRRLERDEIEIREEPVKHLEPGEGVYTLLRRNNIHWQEGLAHGTVLLNINWQGFFADNPMSGENSIHGRCHIDWTRARRGSEDGTFIVPEIADA